MNHFLDKKSGLYLPQSLSTGMNAYSATGYGNGNAGFGDAMIDWNALSTDANSDIIMNQDVLRQRSRDLFMNAPLANGALKKIVSNVVGSGLKLNSHIRHKYLGIKRKKAEDIEEQIEFEFKLWAENPRACDSAGTLNFYDMQRLAMLSVLMSGDTFVFLPIIKRKDSIYDLKLKFVESDRIQDPPAKDMTKNILGGIELDKTSGLPTHLYVVNQLPNAINYAQIKPTEWKRIPIYGENSGRRNVIHLFTVERPEQRRGIPILSPIVEMFKQLTRYSDAEITAAVVSGMLSVFIECENPAQDPFKEIPNDPRSKINYTGRKLTPGMIMTMRRGDKVKVLEPGRPNPNFENFVNNILRQIGTSLEIPFEVLIGHFQSSYSASRAAILAAWQVFLTRRQWLIEHFCQPIYEEWLTEAVIKGRIELDGFLDDPARKAAWSQADFFGPSMPQIDPTKEVKAAKDRVDSGFSTMAYETAQLTGENFDEISKVRKREEKSRDKFRRSEKITVSGTVKAKKMLANNKDKSKKNKKGAPNGTQD